MFLNKIKKRKKKNKYNKMFSFIVPMHNCSKTINRVIESIINQKDLQKEEYEIIIVNDGCLDDSVKKVKAYKNKANFVFCKNKTEIHSPSIARNIGLNASSGEWITFIDHDDEFKEDIFSSIKNIINEKNPKYYIATKFQIYDNISGEFLNSSDDGRIESESWLHGKFYNKKNLLDPYNIRFDARLNAHDDINFNFKTKLIINLISKKIDLITFEYEDLYTYNHYYNLESESNKFLQTKEDVVFTYESIHVDDYLLAFIDPILNYRENFENKEDIKVLNTSICINLLNAHFLVEAMKNQAHFREEDYYINSIKALNDYKQKLLYYFTKEQIIKIIYDIGPEEYESFRNWRNPFIETRSFTDFIMQD